MHLNSGQKFKGVVNISKYDDNMTLIEEKIIPNLVVDDGKEFIISRMIGNTPAVMSHMAVGSNSILQTALDSSLGAELARVALTSTTSSGLTVTYTATFGAGVGTGNLTEAGIFNAASAGTMLCRTVFSAINKTAGQTIVITWLITLI